MATTAVKKKTGSMKAQHVVSRVLIYVLLIVVAALMLIPFLWMLSASFKLNKDVFTFPIEWIPSNPRPQNYVDIWTKIPLLTFVKNTAFLTIIVTILQVLTSSFAAYAFAKLNFKGKSAKRRKPYARFAENPVIVKKLYFGKSVGNFYYGFFNALVGG